MRAQAAGVGEIVRDALLHFDGDRYEVAAAVVMPNHVHVLVGLIGTTGVREQCRSWKHYTGVRINRLLDRRGEFWQVESFDHAVRTPVAFDQFRKYIVENPCQAGLRESEYLLYSRPVASRSGR